MTREELAKQRTSKIIKANELIQRSRYDLTLRQQKLVLFLISRIQKTDTVDHVYHTSIREISEVCNFPNDGSWTLIKKDLLKLTERKWGVTITGEEATISWIGDVIFPETGGVDITFNKYMAPYLFQLHEQYTQMKLDDVLVFRCKYSVRLYEYIRSYAGQHRLEEDTETDIAYHPVRITLSDQELRKRVECVDQYPKWKEFHRSVLKKAVDEINRNNTDIHISYTTQESAQGRLITFTVISKDGGKTIKDMHNLNIEFVEAYNNRQDKLGTGKHIGKR